MRRGRSMGVQAMPYRPGVCAAALAAAVAGMLPSAVLAQDAAPVRITRYGTFEVRQEMPAHDRKAGATGVTELTTIVDPYLLERTSRVDARLCRRFGIWFDLPYGVPGFPASVIIRLTHPVLVRPDGHSGTVETWPQQVGGGGSMAGFTFSEPWEVAPGTWTFAILSGGAVLAEQAFEVVAPTRPGAALPGSGSADCDAPVS